MPTLKAKSKTKPVTRSVRDTAVASLKRLPADATYEDMQYRLYVLEKISKGEAALKEKGGIPQAEAKRRMQKWLSR